MDLLNGNQISNWIAQAGIWPLVVVLVPNLMFRKYGQAAVKKRMASLLQAIAVFVVTTAAAFIMEKNITDLYLLITIAVVAVVLYIFRAKVFPYTLKCAECGASLDFRTIYFIDDNACPACHDKLQAEKKAAEEDDDDSESAEDAAERSEDSAEESEDEPEDSGSDETES